MFAIGPASSHTVLLYAVCFEVAGIIWYFAAVRGRLKRGEAGPALRCLSPRRLRANNQDSLIKVS